MAALTQNSKVLIIGAGIAGLALAQMLRKEGIDFEIFERDDGKRKQGWTLGLDKSLPRLRPRLPDDLPDLKNASANQAAGGHDSVAFINGQTGEFLGTVTNEQGEMVMADRNTLRKILMTNLKINYSKQFASYEHDSKGVIAYFKDGSSAKGTILVGADGSNSRVRAQLLHPFQPVLSKAVIFNGEMELTNFQYQGITAKGTVGVLFGEPTVKGTFFIGEWLDEGKALFHWDCSLFSGDADQNHSWSEHASQEELLEKVIEITAHLPPYLRDNIKATKAEDVQRPPIKLIETVLPVDRLPAGPVTLLGDSAHSMVPFRGMGANTALIASVDLAEAIIDGIKHENSIEDVLRPFEELMIPRGRSHVLESRAVAESDTQFDISGERLDAQKVAKSE